MSGLRLELLLLPIKPQSSGAQASWNNFDDWYRLRQVATGVGGLLHSAQAPDATELFKSFELMHYPL